MGSLIAGIELDNHQVRVVIADHSLLSSKLIKANTFYREESENLNDFWHRIRAALPENLDSITINNNPLQNTSRIMEFPFGDIRKAEQSMVFELEEYLPFYFDDVMAISSIIENNKEKTKILATTTPKKNLLEHIENLKKVNLDPHSILFTGGVLDNLVDTQENEHIGILFINDNYSQLSIIKNTLQFSRSFHIGTSHIIESLDSEKSADDTQISNVYSVENSEKNISSSVRTNLEPLLKQLKHTFNALNSENIPNHLVLVGNLEKLVDLDKYLQKHLHIPTQKINFLDSLKKIEILDTLDESYILPTCLALHVIRQGHHSPINFRQKELAYSGNIKIYKQEFKRFLLGTLIIAILFFSGAFANYSILNTKYKKIQNSFCDITKEIIGKAICDPTTAISILKAESTQLIGLKSFKYSTADLYETISKTIESNTDVIFKELDFRLESKGASIRGKGEAGSFDNIEELKTQIKKDKCFEKVDILKQRKTKNKDRVSFSIEIGIKCPKNIFPGHGLKPIKRILPPSPEPIKKEGGIPVVQPIIPPKQQVNKLLKIKEEKIRRSPKMYREEKEDRKKPEKGNRLTPKNSMKNKFIKHPIKLFHDPYNLKNKIIPEKIKNFRE